ncbi:MAG TPA: hypothetical protein VG142_15555 [Trebonia sp.]|nr:hypothetical protein [Trebonia sp.]
MKDAAGLGDGEAPLVAGAGAVADAESEAEAAAEAADADAAAKADAEAAAEAEAEADEDDLLAAVADREVEGAADGENIAGWVDSEVEHPAAAAETRTIRVAAPAAGVARAFMEPPAFD